MPTLKSPGILINEKAEEFQSTGSISTNPTVIIGEFDNGEAFVPRTVNLKGLKQFYKSGNSFAYLTAKKILEEDETVTVVRVTENDGNNEHETNYINLKFGDGEDTETFRHFVLGLGGKLYKETLGTDFLSVNDQSITQDGGSKISDLLGKTDFELEIKDSSDDVLLTQTVSLNPDSDNYIFDLPSEYGNNHIYLMFGEEIGDFITDNVTINYDSISYATQSVKAETPMILSNDSPNKEIFKFKTRSVGSNLNKAYKIQIANIDTDKKTFDVHVRSFGDSYKYKSILESFYGVNFDPDSANYICNVIGDQYSKIETDGFMVTKGNFSNNSNYIYIEPSTSLNNGDFIGTLPVGFGAMKNIFQTVNIAPFFMDINKDYATAGDYGFDFDNYHILAPVDSGTIDETIGYDTDQTSFILDITETNTKTNGFLIPLYKGFDGSLAIKEYNNMTEDNICGFDFSDGSDGTEETSPGYIAFDTAFKVLTNFDQYDFEKIVINLPYTLCPMTVKRSIDFCINERKGTAFSVFDTDIKDASFTSTKAYNMAKDLDTTYAFTAFTNWIRISDDGKYRFIPESCLLPKILSQSDNIANLYSAPAFVNRGRILDAVSVGKVSSNDERDWLYENGINPVKVVRDYGITLYGHRTPTIRDVITKEIQIRRVSNYIKRFIVAQTELILGEANTDENKDLFRSRIEPFLNGIVSNGGLDKYELSFGTNTSSNRNTLFVELYIFPPSAINFVQLDINVTSDNTTVEEV